MSENQFLSHQNEDLSSLYSQVRNIKNNYSRTNAQINGLQNQVQRIEDRYSKFNADLVYTQQQLETVIASLEKEHNIIADHSERIRLFTDKNTKNNNSSKLSHSSPFLVLLSQWLYVPVMHLIKGTYSVISPVVYTFHSLSLFNSNISRQGSSPLGESDRFSRSSGGMNDVFNLLQMGKLDPMDVNASKK